MLSTQDQQLCYLPLFLSLLHE